MAKKKKRKTKGRKKRQRRTPIRIPAKVGQAVSLLMATNSPAAVINAYLRGVQDVLNVPDGWTVDQKSNTIVPPEPKKKKNA